MVTLEQAKSMFNKMVSDSEYSYEIFDVWEVKLNEPIYVMTVIDENGVQRFPGDPFPSIRKSDGELVDYSFPCPA